MKCGLLGRKLGHSYSAEIHALLGDYEYKLYEREPDTLYEFVRHGDLDGFNVTIPYKKDVIPMCDILSERASKIGSVNTIVRKGGRIYGYNTDYDGFLTMVKASGVDVRGKKAIVLGSGGASLTVCAVLRDSGVDDLTVISRTGEDNYENISRHFDAQIIVNATPVGMVPNTGSSLVDLTRFSKCALVLDLIYNPARTALLLQAERLGIPCQNGLSMLVSQAKRASELFQELAVSDEVIETITKKLDGKRRSIVLVGMPGCGKTTVGKILAEKTGRDLFDCDTEFEKIHGISAGDYITEHGENAFREKESVLLRTLGTMTGKIIATGGGCITKAENFAYLRENAHVVWLRRALDKLETAGRPLSSDLEKMYIERMPRYALISDFQIKNDKTPLIAAEEILRRFCE